MNLKKAKIIRKTLRREGTPPNGVAYTPELPYHTWKGCKPLRLHPACGRFKYKFVKKGLAGKLPTV